MAESKKVERRRHFRGKARAGRRVELTYRKKDEVTREPGEAVSAVTSNIGVGGAFILSQDPEAVGTRLALELRLPTSDVPIEVEAEVRWVVEPEDDRHGPGMGVKFHGLDVESLLRLSEYFASLTGSENGP